MNKPRLILSQNGVWISILFLKDLWLFFPLIAAIKQSSLWKLCQLTNGEKLSSSIPKASFMLPTVTFECMETHNVLYVSSMEEIK